MRDAVIDTVIISTLVTLLFLALARTVPWAAGILLVAVAVVGLPIFVWELKEERYFSRTWATIGVLLAVTLLVIGVLILVGVMGP